MPTPYDRLGQENKNTNANKQLLLKRQYCVNDTSGQEDLIRSLLTPYAAKLVIQQLTLAKREVRKYEITSTGEDTFIVKREDRHHTVNVTEVMASCTCNFKKRQELPCRHIVVVCMEKDLPLFQESYIPPRWKKTYQLPHSSSVSSKSLATVARVQSKPPTSKRERYQEVSRLLKVIGDQCSDVGHHEFASRYDLLCLLSNSWLQGKTVALTVSYIVNINHTLEL